MCSEDVGAVCGAQGHPIATPPLAEHHTNKLLMPQGLHAVKAACAALVIVNHYSITATSARAGAPQVLECEKTKPKLVDIAWVECSQGVDRPQHISFSSVALHTALSDRLNCSYVNSQTNHT